MNIWLKKHRLLVLTTLAYMAGLGLAAFIWFGPGPGNLRSAKAPFSQPAEGWEICQDLGIGTVPGLPDNRQRFRLCHPQGWEYLVYCLDPGLPTPAMGAVCSEIYDGIFDCGGYTQRLRLYEVAATPPPRATRTPTRAPTRTLTPTITSTPTRRVLTVRPPMRTMTPTDVCEPPDSCPPHTVTRPHPGGRGNRLWLGLLALSIAGLVLIQGRTVLIRRRK